MAFHPSPILLRRPSYALPKLWGGLDFGYADGHCKWISASSYGTLQWELSDAPKPIH